MGKAQYLLQRDVAKEEADIQSKFKKRGLWANIGMGIGGLLAIGLTGAAAAPAVAGLMAAGGTFAGGKLGDIAAREGLFGSGKARIKGQGKFLSGQRAGVVSKIGEDILAGSVKTGLGATFAAAGGFKGLTKEGGGGLGKIFQRGDTIGQTEGFGKLFDYKGSAIGKGFEKRALAKELTGLEKFGESKIGTTGEGIVTGRGKTLDYMREDFIGPPPAPGLRTRTPIAAEDIAGRVSDARYASMPVGEGAYSAIDKPLGPYFPKVEKGTPFKRPTRTTTGIFDEADLYDWEGDIADIGSRPSAYDIQKSKRTALEGFFEDPENLKEYGHDLYNKGAGFAGDDVQQTRDILSRDFSANQMTEFWSPPSKPNVPIELEREFLTPDETSIGPPSPPQDLGFSTFDEASWEKGRRTLSNIDFGLADEEIPWQKRFFPSDKSGKPGRFDPRY